MTSLVCQTEATECGLASLCMVANHHGHRFDLAGLRQRFDVSLKGAGLKDLMRMADDLGLAPRALRCEPEHLSDLKLPAILHWDLNHFVVLAKVGERKLTVLDPGRGELRLTREEFSDHFTGVVLELTPTTTFKPMEQRTKARLSDLWSRAVGAKRSLVQILILSVVLQLFALASPFYLQLVVDEAVTSYDPDLLTLLALGFGFLYVINAASTALRSWVILVLGQSVTFQMAGNVVRHLVRLPASFFEKRHTGDVISRMGSIAPIQQALTQSVIAAVIDGVMMVVMAALILVYAWQLALVVFGFVAAYTALSLGLFPLMRRREEALIQASADEQTFTIETIRASRAVKLFGREAEREAGWRNKYAEVVNKGIASGRLSVLTGFANSLLFGLQLVLVVYLGARAVLAGDLTVGMLFAFLAYRQQFSDRVASLVAKGIEFRMLGLHLERLADIVHQPQEEGLDVPSALERPLRGGLTLDGLTFRYGSNEAPVFDGLDLDVRPGEFVAIAGASGGGKTTLLKVMLGLLKAERGEVRADGLPLSSHGLRSFRAQTGVVMQDDALLSGTIADNIAFFDPELDMARVQAAAMAAQIHDDIARMPMNYLSMIGDMGAALSGGQRQRLLIARALYRNPKILFMDEGTANLDEASERAVGEVLSAMPITRIVIAHRPELIERADRVLVMEEGGLREVRSERLCEPAMAAE